ncbi:hypothetical protein [Streptomyces sp. NPDC057636]|uniref:hypothetical protein n=1 Tax=Streptomyces sp. NPDC057636 TaxID=3346189 RepID=UPI0036A8ECB9
MTVEDTTQTSAEPADGHASADTPDAPEDALGEGGKRALAALRDEVKSLKAELKKYQAPEPASDAERDASEEASSTSESTRDAAPTSDEDPAATADDVKPARPQFQGTGDGGATRGTLAFARQLTESDLRSMTPRQIERARKAGQLRDLLRGNSR